MDKKKEKKVYNLKLTKRQIKKNNFFKKNQQIKKVYIIKCLYKIFLHT